VPEPKSFANHGSPTTVHHQHELQQERSSRPAKRGRQRQRDLFYCEIERYASLNLHRSRRPEHTGRTPEALDNIVIMGILHPKLNLKDGNDSHLIAAAHKIPADIYS
jgi:hypothetical protein